MADRQEQRQLWGMIRSKIQYTGSWIQQRVSWHLVSTAFLFSAYVSLVSSADSRPNEVTVLTSILLVLIPVVGATFSIFVYVGIRVASQDIDQALDEWHTLGPGAAARKKLPAMDLPPSSLRLARIANIGVSFTSIALWFILMALSVARGGGILSE